MNRHRAPVLFRLLLLSSFLVATGAGAAAPYTGAVRVFPEKTPSGDLDEPPALRLIGDTIEQPYPISSIPFVAQGTTCGFADNYDEMCPSGGTYGPDVVYAFTPAEFLNVNIDLCRSSFDTKVYVYRDSLTPGVPYACNDDACGPDGYRSRIEFLDLFPGHTYYIVVDAYGSECGNYDLRVEESWICPVPCPPGGIREGEPVCHDDYVDESNSGCGGDPTVFWTIEPSPDPIVICGESGTFTFTGLEFRDTDWYQIETAHPCSLTVQVDAEFRVNLFLIRSIDGCYDYEFLETEMPDFCIPASFEHVIDPGTYWIWVAPQEFEGVECGAKYTMTIEGYHPVPTDIVAAAPSLRTSLRTSPNPFNPSVTIAFDLARAGTIRLTAHGPDGRLVKTLVSGALPAGGHEIVWTGTMGDGRPAGPGVYFLRLETEEGVETAKVVLVE